MGKRLIRYASRKWTLPLALVLLVSGLFLAAFMAFAADGEQQTSWTVYWVDNNNEAESRPSISGGEPAYGTPTLTVEIAGETYTYPSDNGAADQLLLDRLSLSAWPTPVITETGTGVWTVDYGEGGLPSLAYEVDEEGNVITQEPSGEEDEDGNPTLKPVEPSLPVTWTVTPPTVGDYVLTEVTEENLWEYPSVNGRCGWYYVLQDTVTFEFGLRWGTLKELDGITDAVLAAFRLSASYGGNHHNEVSSQLSDLMEDGEVDLQFEYWDEATGDWAPWGEDTAKEKDPTRARLVISNAWRYNLDGSPVTYKVSAAYGEVEGGDKLYTGGLEENDYFLISYDNTNSTNHGSATDGAYNGGTVYLTLTGTIDYTAQKVWRDNDEGSRPAVELQLWRYRAGEDLNTAAPVRDGNGEIYTWQNPEDQTIMVDALPKYDSEGHRYIYVVREYMEGGGYTQVFGELDEDGTVTKDVVYQLDEDGVARPNGTREAGNTYLYNGGTLNNVRSDTVTTQATKVWQAAAFQAEFEDVAVVLTLQSRPKDEGNWTNVTKSDGSPYTETLRDFTAETLSGTTVSASMPKYNNLGEELEYRWVETNVTQGTYNTGFKRIDEKTASFTLIQDDNIPNEEDGATERAVQYTSTTQVDETTGATTITNQLSGTIYYEVDKWWQVPVGELPENPGDDPGYKQVGGSWYTKNAPEDKTSVTFDLYRVISGETLGVGSEPYLTFTMNGEEIEITKKPNDATITTDSNGTWFGRLNGLPEFNEAGQQYEYILVEQGQSPTYDVNRYSEGYQTTVYNPEGPGGIRIMVQKQWIDDSDTAHREPVTIQAYNKEGTQIGNSVTLGDGVWYGWIGLPGYTTDDIINSNIIVREVSMGSDGEYKVEADKYVTTDHHRYEVTYSEPVPLGESANEFIATVTNRRLGNIDLTVTKTWNSGDGTEAEKLEAALNGAGMSLALRLEFHETTPADSIATSGGEAVISRNGVDAERGDIIYIGTENVPIYKDKDYTAPAASVQTIEIPTGISDDKTREYYFHNLPKYDLNGTTVRYAVVEGLVDGNGNFQTIGDYLASNPNPTLAEELRNWSVSYGEETYNSAVDGTEDEGKDLDTQVVPISNTLTGSKPVSWHKEWRDAYTYDQNQRPDIYLDIYQMVHDNDGTTHLELYQADYKWEQSTDEGSTDTANHWTATIAGVPKYDRLGYEITYYAVERTAVNAAAFDYAPVEYWFDTGGDGEEGPTKIGTRIEIEKAYEKEDYAASLKEIYDQTGSDLIHPYEGLPGYNFALAEGGIFRNQLSAALTLSGQKLWTNVPEAFAAVDLPPVTFTLSRSTEGGTDAVERAATLKVTDWASVQENGSYRFAFAYEGNWEMRRENGSTIYTAESGNTITVSDDGTVTYQPGEGDGTPGTGVPSWATPLPKYDEYGNRYIYTMEETSVWLPDDNGNLVPVPVEGEDQGGGETTSPEPTSTGGAETRSGEGTDGAAGEGGQTETSAVDLNVIFESISMDENAYRANNAYREGSGQLTVKKWLKLEQVDGKYVYPAVTVVLSRSYTSYSETGAATEKDEGVVATYTWTADDWEVASTGADENGWVSLTHTFGDLERYAPNGSEYTYTITEDKANLGGYDTWAVADDVANSPTETAMSEENKKNSIEIGNEPKEDDTEVDATFINQYIDEPGPDLETVTLTGTKVWDDWEGELRPEIDVMNGKSPPITLEVSRYAPGSPNGGSAIGSLREPIKVTVRYSTQWSEVPDSNEWTYTIKALPEIETEFQKYAPNGMEWVYVVKETFRDESLENAYKGGNKTAKGDAANADENGNVTLSPELKNSLKTNVNFTKTWENKDGDTITEDYLGCDVTVNFVLQVSKSGENNWENASESSYFKSSENDYKFGLTADSFSCELVGRVDNPDKWKGTFGNLPRAVKDETGKIILLSCRVVETQIKYTLPGEEEATTITVTKEEVGDGYTIEGPDGSLITGVSGTNTSITNTLKTVDLKIVKVWANDSDNAYRTRPGDTGSEDDWEVSFLVQYRDGTGEWMAFQTASDGGTPTPLIVTVGGDNTASEAYTLVEDLPGLPNRQYRAVELQPGYDIDNLPASIVAGGGTFHTAYLTTYVHEAPMAEIVPPEGGGDTGGEEEPPAAQPLADNALDGETPDGPEADYTTTATNTLQTTKVFAEKK